MAQTINTNVASLNAQRNLNTSQLSLATSLQRLSSGLRVNSAKDDAAGIAVATKMDSQARGMDVAMRNANDGISLVQIAEGALSTMTDIMQRMRELAVQAANGAYADGGDEQLNLDTEYQELNTELGRIAETTQFNGLFVVEADAGAIAFQVGANSGETLTVTTTDASAYLTAGALTTAAGASTEIDALDTAMQSLNTDRATYGAALNRLQFTIQNLSVGYENQNAARGRIMDADFAKETANLSRTQILQQAGTAMLAQANSSQQNVLSLLQ